MAFFAIFWHIFWPEVPDETDKDEPLNIFCLASGHLYERLLKIMILSVKRTTQVISFKIYLMYCKFLRLRQKSEKLFISWYFLLFFDRKFQKFYTLYLLGWVKNLVFLSFCCHLGYLLALFATFLHIFWPEVPEAKTNIPYFVWLPVICIRDFWKLWFSVWKQPHR